MKALLLGAGHGTRLRPLTDDRPKSMVELAGRPVVDYSLYWLKEQGVDGVAINLHYKGDVLQEHVGGGDRFGLSVRYSDEPRLLGSAGALVPLRSFLAGSDPFVVLYGDVVTALSLAPALACHATLGADLTLVATRTEDPTRSGIVEIGPEGRVTRFREKPKPEEVFSDWCNAGIYVCSPALIAMLPGPCPVPYDFGLDFLPRLLSMDARVAASPTDELLIDIGSQERLNDAAAAVSSGTLGPIGSSNLSKT